MSKHITILCAVALPLIHIQAVVSMADEIDRSLEPVVVECCYLPELVDASVDVGDIRVITHTSTGWTVAPFQVDEGNRLWDTTFEMNLYTYDITKDESPGLIDNTDEICLMTQDLGERASHDNWMELSGNFRYEIGVYDGRDHSYKGWAYVVVAPDLPLDPTDYIDVTETNTFESDYFKIAFRANADHIMEDLSIKPPNGDNTDFYDRSKTRVRCKIGPIPFTFTENDLNIDNRILVDGAVRCVAQFDGYSADESRTLYSVSSYYQRFIDTDNALSTVSKLISDYPYIRYSRDLDENVDGLTVYTDFGYECQEFVVDGEGDIPVTVPLGTYIEVDHPTAGCNVLVQDLSDVPGEVKFFYQDGGNDPSGRNTGSNGLWGEHGFIVHDPPETTMTINSKTYMLPAAQGCVGPYYRELYTFPIQVAGAYLTRNPVCLIYATPDENNLILPRVGGDVSFRVDVENLTGETQHLVAWIDVTVPLGSLPGNECVYGPVFGPKTLTIPGQFQGWQHLDVTIPPYAPDGAFTMNCKIGYSTGNIIWSDSFPFWKTDTF